VLGTTRAAPGRLVQNQPLAFEILQVATGGLWTDAQRLRQPLGRGLALLEEVFQNVMLRGRLLKSTHSLRPWIVDWAAFGSGSQSIDRESARSKQPVKKTAYCYILASIAQALTTFALLKYAKNDYATIKLF
jgi:hypothetical protein